MKIKKRVKCLISLALTVSMLSVPSMNLRASNISNVNFNTGTTIETNEDVKITALTDSISEGLQKNLTTDFEIDSTKPQIDVSAQLKSRGTTSMGTDPVGVLPGSLTASDNMEMHFFSTTQNALLFLGLSSTNANYYVQLYMVDFNTGKATPTNVIISAGNSSAVNGIPKGDYMFVVASANGSVGQTYKMMVNIQNPAGNVRTLVYVNDTFENAIILYTDGSVYANGKYAFNYDNPDTSDLNWERVFQLNYPGGGYHTRTHEISSVKIKKIWLRPISYTSNYTKSTFALEIELAPETLFLYRDVVYQNGGPMTVDCIDTTGQETPRRLTALDTYEKECVLVYSLNEMKPIDLCGDLNWYYYNNVESEVRTGLK